MDGTTHAALGAATSLVLIHPTKPEDLIITVSVGAFAALLPDIDTGGKAAPIVRKITAGFIAVILFFVAQAQVTGSTVIESINNSGLVVNLLGIAILIGFSCYGGTQPHRGFTHSLIACAIASFSAYLVFKGITPAFVIGYLSHLAVDYPNKKGEQFLWPLNKRWCLNLCTSNGVAAMCIRLASYSVCIIYMGVLGLR